MYKQLKKMINKNSNTHKIWSRSKCETKKKNSN